MKTEELQKWIGKTEERTDVLTSFPATALAATLNHKELDYSENKKFTAIMALALFSANFQVIRSRLRRTCSIG